jgi:phage regulator Rha-like protein
MKKIITIDNLDIDNKIFSLRGIQVMLDEDLAILYGVELKRLNEQVKRNIERFPHRFRFQLTKEEYENLRSQIATSSFTHGGRRTLPFVFTEQGVSMLSAVLRSKTAVEVSIKIIDTFVSMRKYLQNNASIFQRLDNLETNQIQYQIQTDAKFDKIFKVIDEREIKPKQGIFYNGQIFDAYVFVSDLIKTAEKSIVVIDNYIDVTVLTLLSKNQNINITIYTKIISKQLKLDIEKYNLQYKKISIKKFDLSHDRFLIIDDKEVYHIGASLKDLGNKWFAFSKMDINSFELLGKLQ